MTFTAYSEGAFKAGSGIVIEPGSLNLLVSGDLVPLATGNNRDTETWNTSGWNFGSVTSGSVLDGRLVGVAVNNVDASGVDNRANFKLCTNLVLTLDFNSRGGTQQQVFLDVLDKAVTANYTYFKVNADLDVFRNCLVAFTTASLGGSDVYLGYICSSSRDVSVGLSPYISGVDSSDYNPTVNNIMTNIQSTFAFRVEPTYTSSAYVPYSVYLDTCTVLTNVPDSFFTSVANGSGRWYGSKNSEYSSWEENKQDFTTKNLNLKTREIDSNLVYGEVPQVLSGSLDLDVSGSLFGTVTGSLSGSLEGIVSGTISGFVDNFSTDSFPLTYSGSVSGSVSGSGIFIEDANVQAAVQVSGRDLVNGNYVGSLSATDFTGSFMFSKPNLRTASLDTFSGKISNSVLSNTAFRTTGTGHLTVQDISSFGQGWYFSGSSNAGSSSVWNKTYLEGTIEQGYYTADNPYLEIVPYTNENIIEEFYLSGSTVKNMFSMSLGSLSGRIDLAPSSSFIHDIETGEDSNMYVRIEGTGSQSEVENFSGSLTIQSSGNLSSWTQVNLTGSFGYTIYNRFDDPLSINIVSTTPYGSFYHSQSLMLVSYLNRVEGSFGDTTIILGYVPFTNTVIPNSKVAVRSEIDLETVSYAYPIVANLDYFSGSYTSSLGVSGSWPTSSGTRFVYALTGSFIALHGTGSGGIITSTRSSTVGSSILFRDSESSTFRLVTTRYSGSVNNFTGISGSLFSGLVSSSRSGSTGYLRPSELGSLSGVVDGRLDGNLDGGLVSVVSKKTITACTGSCRRVSGSFSEGFLSGSINGFSERIGGRTSLEGTINSRELVTIKGKYSGSVDSFKVPGGSTFTVTADTITGETNASVDVYFDRVFSTYETEIVSSSVGDVYSLVSSSEAGPYTLTCTNLNVDCFVSVDSMILTGSGVRLSYSSSQLAGDIYNFTGSTGTEGSVEFIKINQTERAINTASIGYVSASVFVETCNVSSGSLSSSRDISITGSLTGSLKSTTTSSVSSSVSGSYFGTLNKVNDETRNLQISGTLFGNIGAIECNQYVSGTFDSFVTGTVNLITDNLLVSGSGKVIVQGSAVGSVGNIVEGKDRSFFTVQEFSGSVFPEDTTVEALKTMNLSDMKIVSLVYAPGAVLLDHNIVPGCMFDSENNIIPFSREVSKQMYVKSTATLPDVGDIIYTDNKATTRIVSSKVYSSNLDQILVVDNLGIIVSKFNRL